jgi:hypothetical protein
MEAGLSRETGLEAFGLKVIELRRLFVCVRQVTTCQNFRVLAVMQVA